MDVDNSYEKLSETDKKIIDAMFAHSHLKREPVENDQSNDGEGFSLEQYGHVPLDIEIVEVVQDGLETKAILLLERDGQYIGRFDVELDPETLEVDREKIISEADYPYESAALIDSALKKHCEEKKISPPLTDSKVGSWVSEYFGEGFSLEKSGEDHHLVSQRGIWAKGGELSVIINRVEKSLVCDRQFLMEVSRSITGPDNLQSTGGEYLSRSVAFAREKVLHAIENRPDRLMNDKRNIFENSYDDLPKFASKISI